MEHVSIVEFTYKNESYMGPYGKIIHKSYTLDKNGYEFTIFTTADGKWWLGVVYKNGKYLGDTLGDTVLQHIAYINMCIDKGYIK